MNAEMKEESYDGVVLDSLLSIGLLSEKRDSTHPYSCCLWHLEELAIESPSCDSGSLCQHS